MRRIHPTTYLLLFFITPFLMRAQICDGNLGENIFTDGDFGSGVTNILSPNPMIAPGYDYVFTGPPNDGFYTVTNNTGAWPLLYNTWLAIEDNSDDPEGYMMVVNASFSPGLFYEQTIDGLCDNTDYVFTADIINLIAQGVTGHLAPNVTFLIDGEVRFTTGDIPQTNEWNTYGFTFTTDPGQTTVTLSLRNNAPGGIGNDLALDNISFQACGPLAQILPFTIANICEDGNPIELEATITGDQFPDPAIQWQRSNDEGQTWEDIPGENGLTYTHAELAAGFYYYRYLIANSPTNLQNPKCRIISNIKIVRVAPKFHFINDTICAGTSIEIGGIEFTEPGSYVDSLISDIGCDSIVTVTVEVVDDPDITAQVDFTLPNCADDSNIQVNISNIQNGYPPYDIQFDDFLVPGPEVIFDNLTADAYPLFITDRFGCNLLDTVTIPAPEPFVIEFGPDLSIDLGESVSINGTTNYSIDQILWTPGIVDFDCMEGCLEVSGFPTGTTEYIISATSELGCMAFDTVFIEVNTVREVYIPNAFSPNDDGLNDVFTVFGNTPNVVEVETFQIFDRWGNLVFENNNFPPNAIDAGWNGKFGGRSLKNDVYLYVAEIRFLDGLTETYTGDVVILR